jgi:hypothetical protein
MTLSNPSDPNPVPQFAKAEYAAKPGAEKCATCKNAVGTRYYRVDGALNCETCAEIARRQLPTDSHAKFVRGLLFGVGGAILGLILYSTFAIATGLVIGYLALGVGYIVGKAMNMGSQGTGGRRYQIAAVLLTYAAVSLSAIPIAISQSAKSHASRNHSAAVDDDSDTRANSSRENGHEPPGTESDRTVAPPPAKKSFAASIGYLMLLGLASPLLELQEPFHGLIGLVILSVGIRIAWRLTAGSNLQVLGPFENSVPAPASQA